MSSYIIGIIRVSRVRTPDRALENRCFCGHWSCGDGGFCVQQLINAEKRCVDQLRKEPKEIQLFRSVFCASIKAKMTKLYHIGKM